MQPPPIPVAYKIRSLLGKPLRRRLTTARARFLHSAHADCRSTQHALLRDLLQLNADTAFARQHQLHPGMSLAEFRSRIPVADYEFFRPWIDRVATGEHSALLGPQNQLLMFALTSGTTDASKKIPVTSRFLKDYRRGWQQWGVGVYQHFPRLPDLNIVQISSSHRRSFTPGGTPCGNISGLVATMQNAVVRSLYTVSADVAEVHQQHLKRRFTLLLALADPHVGVFMTANPATLMQLFQDITDNAEELIRDLRDGVRDQIPADCRTASSLRCKLGPQPTRAAQLADILKQHGRLTPRKLWPWLQVLGVWTGGSAAAWRQGLSELCENIPVWDHGLHASEGRMTLPLEPGRSSGVLEIQTHFFEFLPVSEEQSASPVVLEAHELQEGGEYYILLTTSSGLCRYHIRDVVRCTGFHGATPLLEFLHKGAHISSITGEKISESQVVQAVRQAASNTVPLRLFTLTAAWAQPPGYALYLQLPADTSPQLLSTFAGAVDQFLCDANEEYRDKRGSGRLGPIRPGLLPDAAWKSLQQARLQRSGGSPEQYKHPFLLPDPEFRDLFLKDCGVTDRNRGH
ncbi:MAG: GH3 auxin-responsive promoter family protein [Planctomycetota bacterium]